ncbi:MAG: 50S ribosomal protein L32 [Clostridia bacterium]
MAVPKTKTSKQRKHTRTANWKVSAPSLAECPQCHELKVTHQVCDSCGFYDGKEIVKKTEEKKK